MNYFNLTVISARNFLAKLWQLIFNNQLDSIYCKNTIAEL